MLPWKTKRPKGFDAGTDTLDRLLDRELQIASQLTAAKAEAQRLVLEATEYAIRAEAACEATIGARDASLATAHEAELQHELQRIQSDAAAEAATYSVTDSGQTRTLVTLLLDAIGATSPTTRGTG